MKKRMSVADFIANERFLRWILKPNENDEAYWRQWIDQNQHNRNPFEDAIKAVGQFQGKERKGHSETKKWHLWSRIKNTIDQKKS